MIVQTSRGKEVEIGLVGPSTNFSETDRCQMFPSEFRLFPSVVRKCMYREWQAACQKSLCMCVCMFFWQSSSIHVYVYACVLHVTITEVSTFSPAQVHGLQVGYTKVCPNRQKLLLAVEGY